MRPIGSAVQMSGAVNVTAVCGHRNRRPPPRLTNQNGRRAGPRIRQQVVGGRGGGRGELELRAGRAVSQLIRVAARRRGAAALSGGR